MNAELLAETMAWVEQHPEKHNQGRWYDNTPCGATYCFAGHAAILAGAQAPDHLGSYQTWYITESGVAVDQYDNGRAAVPVEKFAKAALDLTGEQAAYLFDQDRTVAELRLLVDMITADPHITGDTIFDELHAVWLAAEPKEHHTP